MLLSARQRAAVDRQHRTGRVAVARQRKVERRFGDIVAVCDVDDKHAEAAAKRLTKNGKVPAKYSDFRKVMEREDVHVIVNGTPYARAVETPEYRFWDQYNPISESFGAMLERCGLKGHRIGGALISPKHANFIENAGGATTADCLALMAEARRRAREEFGAELEHEVQLLGEIVVG